MRCGDAGIDNEHEHFIVKVYTSENKKKLLKKEEYEKIECIVDKDNLNGLIGELKQVVTDGVVIALPVDLILNR